MDAPHQAPPGGLHTPECRRSQVPPPTPSTRHQQQLVLQQMQQQQLEQQQLQQQQLQQQQQQLLLHLQQLNVQQQQDPQLTRSPSPQPTRSRYARAIENERAFIDVDALRREAEVQTGLGLFAMKRQKRKHVWHFARLVRLEVCWQISRNDLTNEHSELAYCLLCDLTMKFRVGNCKMPQHIDACHPDELAAFGAQKGSAGLPVIRNLDNEFAAVEDPRKKRKLRVITAKEQKRVNELLAEWAARHFRPLIIVEDAGFLAFVRFITEDLGGVTLTLPKRARLRQEIIVLAEEYRRRVKKDIASGCEYYSITVDIWTARNAKSYISLTIHYVDQNFTPKNWTLEVLEFPGIHTGRTIAAAINRIMANWALVKRLCVKLLRDSGSNMVSAGNKLGIDHMACIAHSLHLVVAGALVKKSKARGDVEKPAWANDIAAESENEVAEREEEAELSSEDRGRIEVLQELAIDEMDDTIAGLRRNEMSALRKIVQYFRTLAVYFRKSPKGDNRLGKIQVSHCNVNPEQVLRPIVDCPTRWNSCWEMLQRLITLEGALVKFFAYLKKPEGRAEFNDMEKKLRRPKSEEWLAIKCLQTLLGPFAIASETLSGQTYPTSPLILPALSGIRKHLERADLFDTLAAEAGDENYVLETKVMMNECRTAMLTLYTKRFQAIEESELKWVSFLDPRVAKRMSHLSPADTPGACKEVVIIIPARPTKLEEDCENEFTRYLGAVTTVKSATSPFDWWRVNAGNYPNLSRLARKWLGTVATSVPSERAFSTSGNILTVKRSSLSPALVRDLVFIAENWRVGHH